MRTPGSEDQRRAAEFATLTAEDGERHAPFRWQKRLLQRLLDGDPPQAVDVPTGLGKTSVMALWLIALAEGAELPRRLVYVVDRRAVVDQATRFAEQLRRNMPNALAGKLHLDEMISGRIQLEDVNDALTALETGEVARNVIVFD